MVRYVLLTVTLIIAAVSVPTHAAETYGTAPDLSQVTPIPQLLSKPADFEGRTVRVEGVVTAVCTMMGCWMAIAPSDAPKGQAVLVKVDDGVIVFPVSARGKRASAQGVFQRVGSGDAEGHEAAHEHAKQEGRHDSSNAPKWQLKATGAIVY